VVHAPHTGQGSDRLGVLHPLHQRALRSPTRHNPLGELVSLCKTSTVDDYTECFLAHVARARALDEQQQVNIYTVGLLKPLKTYVEL
jgi:hypothetical protein